jgi:hypothetical protein
LLAGICRPLLTQMSEFAAIPPQLTNQSLQAGSA